MAGEQQQRDKKIGFKTIVLLKDQTLGIGSYGSVCRAKCDDLLCAAKVIHPTLFNPTALQQIAPHREHRLPIRRFQLECEFMSTLHHPNIVQYLGTHQDPDTRLPVLLMELMDESLTHFLESSPLLIPYHVQVNICHDISRALSFLHSNGIVHRDLSSNNVLLISNIRAKLTDFGMVRLGNLNAQATHFTNTMCPGTDVYMPPEAVQDKPVYTEKIDCFSFGVIAVQILIQEFPKPGERHITVNDPHYPQGALKLCVPEIERRQNHISQVDPNHPLLPIALDCLKDADGERPSAQQLCDRVAVLKETANYKNACERVNDNRGKEGEYEQLQHVIDQRDATIAEKIQQLQQCKEEMTQQIQQQSRRIQQLERDKRQVEQERDQAIAEKERQLGRVKQQLEKSKLAKQFQQLERQQIQQLERDKQQVEHTIKESEGKNRARDMQQLKESEGLIADVCKQNIEVEEEFSVLKSQLQRKDGGAKAGAVTQSRTDFKLRWREGEKAPCKMVRYCDPVVGNNTVYCKYGVSEVYSYYVPGSNWTPVTDCPTKGFTITVIGGLLTTIGGYGDGKATNKLYSLIDEGSGRRWTEKFSPMPTRRYKVSALCAGTALIVAGGWGHGGKDEALKIVEVLKTKTQQWHTAADLPQPLSYSSLILCGDLVYLLGGVDEDNDTTSSVYSCSLASLLSSRGSTSLRQRLVNTLTRSISGSPYAWSRVTDLPVKLSTAVNFHSRLLVIGGKDSNDKPSTAVHMYQPTTNSWDVISHMTIPRSGCLSAVLPDDQLMVVGGWTIGHGRATDLVEFGTVF